MDGIKNPLDSVLTRLGQNLPLLSESRPSAMLSDPSSPIWELWQRMTEIYGHQWSSQQGDEPNDTWARGLDGLSPQQFAHGLQALFTRSELWPPNLVEFRQLCTGYDPNAWERRAHKTLDTSHMIEDQTSREKRRAEGLKNILALRAQVGL